MENTRFETSLAVCQGMSTKSSQIALTNELASLSSIPDLTCFQRGFIARLQAKNLLEISGREWEAMGIMRIQLTNKKRRLLMTAKKISSQRANATRKMNQFAGSSQFNQFNQSPGA